MSPKSLSAVDNGGVPDFLFPARRDSGRRAAKAEKAESPQAKNGNSGGSGKGKKGSGRQKPPGKGKAKPRRRRWTWRLARFGLVAAIWGFVAGLGVLAYFAYDLPRVDSVETMTRQPSVTIVSAEGTRLASFGDVYGAVVTLDDLPPYLPMAVLATEDRRFYSHFGLDPFGLARAMVANVRAGRVVQGGSTITQQVAKNLFLTHERTIKRKIQEVMLALWLEQTFSKDEILTIYLNRVYLGAGVHGMEAAAQRYFDVSARDVTLWQAAILAGLMKAPSRLNPAANPDLAADRAREVLQNMVEAEVLTPDQAATAAQGLRVEGLRRTRPGRYFADWVMDNLEGYIGRVTQDLTVVTTLDPGVQRAAEAALADVLDDARAKGRVEQGAVVVLSPEGGVRAMVGGRSYAESQFNRAAQAMRQPGSAFKPFVFAAALEAGLSPLSVLDDSPVSIDGWRPANFDGRYRGPITLTEAMAHSVNTVAVRAAQAAGVESVRRMARRFGVTTDIGDDLSIALGTSETTLLDLTGAYLPFANGGWGVVPHGITEIRTRDGAVLYSRSGGGTGRIAEAQVISGMNAMMQAVVETGTARGADLPGREVAGKTGTSNDNRDAWFIGYTGDYVTGVWLGNDDGAPTKGVTGGGLPVEVWRRVMEAAEQGLPPRALP